MDPVSAKLEEVGYTKLLESWEQLKDNFSQSSVLQEEDALQQRIDQYFNELHAVLMKRKQELKQSVKELFTDIKKEAAQQQEEITKTIGELKQTLDTAVSLLDGSDGGSYVAARMLKVASSNIYEVKPRRTVSLSIPDSFKTNAATVGSVSVETANISSDIPANAHVSPFATSTLTASSTPQGETTEGRKPVLDRRAMVPKNDQMKQLHELLFPLIEENFEVPNPPLACATLEFRNNTSCRLTNIIYRMKHSIFSFKMMWNIPEPQQEFKIPELQPGAVVRCEQMLDFIPKDRYFSWYYHFFQAAFKETKVRSPLRVRQTEVNWTVPLSAIDNRSTVRITFNEGALMYYVQINLPSGSSYTWMS